jgi:hypothetical protein
LALQKHQIENKELNFVVTGHNPVFGHRLAVVLLMLQHQPVV